MRALLQKELRLTMHPTVLIFLSFSAMMLIPGYPFYVVFFYTSLALFFTCQYGRENQDVEFTALLPVKKADVVRARVWFFVLVQMAQMALAAVFSAVRQVLSLPENPVGIEANLAFLGSGFVLLGLFNLVFFGSYYHNVRHVGKAFVRSAVAVFGYMLVAETLVHVLPFARDVLDTPDPQHLPAKAVVFGVGVGIYIGLTAFACRRAQHQFSQQDL